jgi:hypothetical protein
LSRGIAALYSSNSSLPDLKKTISGRSFEVLEALKNIPDSLAERSQANLIGLCLRFVDDIQSCATGGQEHGDFFRTMTSIFRQFKENIRATIPLFNVPKQGNDSASEVDDDIELSGSEDENDQDYGHEAMTDDGKPRTKGTTRY